jgi:preprotein translocase subunit SecD
VQILFDEEGAKLFQELTKKNINKPIAIFVGGELVSAPTVQQEIAGGTAVITGSSTYEEANKLATDLNTGAIPAPIHLTGQNTIEATLGSAAVQDSLKAAIIGFIVLAFFMLVIYRVLGAIAVGALTLYVILLIALMKLPLLLITQHNIVLTLAGIAGIILSIGMAVDANVLIFERMKEEMKKGKSLTTAADTGFKRAWPSIRDGNSSTLITSAILFVIGTSIIRGFAVTLAMGIVLSLFTAIVVTRWLLHRILESPMAERNELFGGRKEGSAE